jgi:hypothetical protein
VQLNPVGARILEADGRTGCRVARCIGQLPRRTGRARIWNPDLAATRSASRFQTARGGAETCSSGHAGKNGLNLMGNRLGLRVEGAPGIKILLLRGEPENQGSRMAAGSAGYVVSTVCGFEEATSHGRASIGGAGIAVALGAPEEPTKVTPRWKNKGEDDGSGRSCKLY